MTENAGRALSWHVRDVPAADGSVAVAEGHYLVDLASPATVYDRLDIAYESPFAEADWIGPVT